MRDVSWKQIVLVLGLTAMLLFALLVLINDNKDAGSILGAFSVVLLSILALFGNNASKNIDTKLDQVKEISNGRTSELMTMVKDLHNQVTQLALSNPPNSASAVTPLSPVSPAAPEPATVELPHDNVPPV